MTTNFSLNQIRNQTQQSTPPPKIKSFFLKGPIPWHWLSAAANCYPKGKSLHVAIRLRFLHGLNRGRSFKFNQSSRLRNLGISRDAARRGLEALERAGLISVTRKRGCVPVIQILEISPAPSDEEDSSDK
jgi:hypothetical protein